MAYPEEVLRLALEQDDLSDTQREYISLHLKLGSIKKVADEKGKSIGTVGNTISRVLNNLSRTAPATDTAKNGAPPGFLMRHAWVKRDEEGQITGTSEFVKADDAQRLERIKDVISALCEQIEPPPPLSRSPKHPNEHLCTVYPMGDPHFGLLSYAAETGENFNLDEAERRTKAAIDRLVTCTPESEIGLLINLGDFFHADDETASTPASKNPLDVDTRHSKVMLVGLMAMVHCIQRLKERHKRVIVWNVRGNHDPQSSMALALSLMSWFRNEPDIDIPINPSLYSYFRHGKTLIAATHGHGAKMNDLPLLMAADRPKDWGETEHRYWLCGHIHHKQKDKEHPGVMVETFNTLAGSDAWHAGKGYRAKKNMQAIVYHSDHGEVERHTCDLSMITEAI